MSNSVLIHFLSLALTFQHNQDVEGQEFRLGLDQSINSDNDQADMLRKTYSRIESDIKNGHDWIWDSKSPSRRTRRGGLDTVNANAHSNSGYDWLLVGVLVIILVYVVGWIFCTICCTYKRSASVQPRLEDRFHLIRYNQQRTTSITQSTSAASNPMSLHVEIPVPIPTNISTPVPVMNSFGIPGSSLEVSDDELPPSYDQLYPDRNNYSKV